MTRKTRQTKSTSEPSPPKKNMADANAKDPKDLTLKDVIDQMKESMHELETKMEKKIDENAKKFEARCKTSDEKLDKIEANTNDMSDRITTLEQEVDSKNKTIQTLQSRVETLEEERRNHNVIIEGLPEEKNGNLRRTLDDLFGFLEVSYDSEWADSVFRIGVKNDKVKRPRAVKVCFLFVRCKNELYKNSYKLKKSQKYQRVYLVEDYPPKVQDQMKVMRAISAFAKSQGIDSKMRGPKIVIDGKASTYGELKHLPHNLTIERAKVIEVEDGVAFQSKHAFLSSHYPCTIKVDDKIYNCSEQLFHYTRAIENNEAAPGVVTVVVKRGADIYI